MAEYLAKSSQLLTSHEINTIDILLSSLLFIKEMHCVRYWTKLGIFPPDNCICRIFTSLFLFLLRKERFSASKQQHIINM